MTTNYLDYFWKMGKPYGVQPIDEKAPYSYRIITDPYHKQYSIEKYKNGKFDKVVYDSILLDFRRLNPMDQMAWQRECLGEKDQLSVYLLRNQDDRVILIETQYFEKNWCRSCTISSVHGVPISIHRMYYKSFGDPFDGVILYDLEDHPVMIKNYQIDPETKEFSTLLNEEWDMQNLSDPFKQLLRS